MPRCRSTLFGGVKRVQVRRPFAPFVCRTRPKRRKRIQIGDPARAQHLLDRAGLAHLLRDARASRASTSSSATTRSEELWTEGAAIRIDRPLLSVKVAQAHIHNLLFHKHARHRFEYIFFPCITHVPSFVVKHDGHSVVPDRRRRAEGDARRVHEGSGLLRRARASSIVDGAVTLSEPNYFAKQMFEMGARASASPKTRTTSPAAQGFAGAARSTRIVQRRGLRSSSSWKRRTASAFCCSGVPTTSIPG